MTNLSVWGGQASWNLKGLVVLYFCGLVEHFLHLEVWEKFTVKHRVALNDYALHPMTFWTKSRDQA